MATAVHRLVAAVPRLVAAVQLLLAAAKLLRICVLEVILLWIVVYALYDFFFPRYKLQNCTTVVKYVYTIYFPEVPGYC